VVPELLVLRGGESIAIDNDALASEVDEVIDGRRILSAVFPLDIVAEVVYKVEK